MDSTTSEELRYASSLSANRRKEILQSLIPIASCAANAQIDAFSLRLANALMAFSENALDPKQANLTFTGANLLKKNAYAYYYLASVRLEEVLREGVKSVDKQPVLEAIDRCEAALELVSYTEMDTKLLLSNIARPLEIKNAEQLKALNMRLACLFDRDELQMSQNPFRPEVFLAAINDAWAEFDPDSDSHDLVLPLLQPDVFLDLGPVLEAINDALISHGILPSLSDAYRIRKSSEALNGTRKPDAAVTQELRRLLSAEGAGGSGGGYSNGSGGGGAGGSGGGGTGSGPTMDPSMQASLQNHMLQMTAVSNQMLGFLAGMQKNLFDQQLSGLATGNPLTTEVLSNIKRQAPQGALSKVDENAIDLLTKVFDMVFHDKNIAPEVKALIGFLQVPVLKAALLDKEFFFQQEHPARRLVEKLTESSLAWDQKKGEDDPLYRTMKRVVDRIQQEFDQEISVFSTGVAELESYVQEEEKVSQQALDAPIHDALKKEKLVKAQQAAKHEVAMRVGTGEVVAFVEAFLENKWTSVLTIAYTLQEEKPQAVQSAVATMDDLVWSVKPKITAAQRKELIAKLPSILLRLNKWLSVVEWEEADRLQFFAELAETHASIVRAPLPLTPERQLELAVEVAKKAAERRLEKLAQVKPEPGPDAFDDKIKTFERGIWLNFVSQQGDTRRAKLSWVSPMRSLFIFTTHRKEETFQVTDRELAQMLREDRAQPVLVDGIVDRALTAAFAPGANDPKIQEKTAA